MDKEVLKDISLTVHKEKSHHRKLWSGNQPSYAPLTYLKRQLMDKSFIMHKTRPRKGYDLTRNTVKS